MEHKIKAVERTVLHINSFLNSGSGGCQKDILTAKKTEYSRRTQRRVFSSNSLCSLPAGIKKKDIDEEKRFDNWKYLPGYNVVGPATSDYYD